MKLLALLLIGLSSVANALDMEADFVPCEKTHVHSHQVALMPQGIFVNLNNEWFQTSAIYSEGEGLYFNDTKASMSWICPKCQYVNRARYNACGKCGYRVL